MYTPTLGRYLLNLESFPLMGSEILQQKMIIALHTTKIQSTSKQELDIDQYPKSLKAYDPTWCSNISVKKSFT